MTGLHHNPLSLIERLEDAAAMNGPHSTVALTVAHIRALESRALAAEAKLAEAREVIAPFALAIKPSVPGNQLMTQFAWEADEIRRAARFMEGNGDG